MTPKLTEVFMIEKPSGKGLYRNASAKQSEDDPVRVSNHGEHYDVPHGTYCVFSAPKVGPNGMPIPGVAATEYYCHYVGGKSANDFENLGHFGNRQGAIQAMLQHHDKKQVGI